MANQQAQLEETFRRRLQPKAVPDIVPPHNGELAGRRRDASLFALAVERIRPDADQVRHFHKASSDPSIQELSASIRAVGVLQPIDVRYVREGDYYQIVAGERRYTAAKLAGLQELPVKLLDAPESEVRRLQILENIHREQLSPLELGSALQQLIEDGAKPHDLAALLSKTESYIAKALSIARNLSPDAERTIKKNPGRFESMAHLYAVSLVPHDQQPALLERVAAENLTRSQVQEAAAELRRRSHTPRSKRGRPRNQTGFTKIIALDDATVTVRLQKAGATTSDLIDVLREAIDMLNGVI